MSQWFSQQSKDTLNDYLRIFWFLYPQWFMSYVLTSYTSIITFSNLLQMSKITPQLSYPYVLISCSYVPFMKSFNYSLCFYNPFKQRLLKYKITMKSRYGLRLNILLRIRLLLSLQRVLKCFTSISQLLTRISFKSLSLQNGLNSFGIDSGMQVVKSTS